MNDFEDEPVEMAQPQEEFAAPEGIWMRGLWMLVFALLFSLAETILAVTALVQFLWMLVTKQRNTLLTEFGADMGKWMRDVARFQSADSDEKPFPWKRWGA